MMNNNLWQMAMRIKNNPTQFFGNLNGVNMQDPNAIIQYLMNNNKITQEQYNQAVNRVNQFRGNK